jgi:hypothetical protein
VSPPESGPPRSGAMGDRGYGLRGLRWRRPSPADVHAPVVDAGTAGTVAARAPNRHGGFGLRLVEALGRRWGVTREGFTRVWVELDCGPASG